MNIFFLTIQIVNYTLIGVLVNDSINGLQKLINDAVGAGKVAVSSSSGILTFSEMGSTNTISLSAGTNYNLLANRTIHGI